MERGAVDAERLKRDFVAMISHELRTPLTTLTGFSELLAMRADSLEPELVAEFGQRMWRASRWLSRMIGDLLDLSQLEQGSLAMNIEATDVTRIMEETAVVEVADRRPISCAAQAGLPPVVADGVRLKQILGNLLSNARKFSPPGSQIDMQASRNRDRVEISVQDYGRGIAAEHLDKIFEPFVQTDPATTREAGGLGTGLYLVRQLCERMGAHVRVESQEGAGSRFVVSLMVAGSLEATA
jgi:two-component system, sensor histidine kinase SagS